MKTVDVVVWLEKYLYLEAGASSRKAAHAAAVGIVNQLVNAGVLRLDDLVPAESAKEMGR